jgi:hypothetical protein
MVMPFKRVSNSCDMGQSRFEVFRVRGISASPFSLRGEHITLPTGSVDDFLNCFQCRSIGQIELQQDDQPAIFGQFGDLVEVGCQLGPESGSFIGNSFGHWVFPWVGCRSHLSSGCRSDEEFFGFAVHGFAVLPSQADAIVILEADDVELSDLIFSDDISFVAPVNGFSFIDGGFDFVECHGLSFVEVIQGMRRETVIAIIYVTSGCRFGW